MSAIAAQTGASLADFNRASLANATNRLDAARQGILASQPAEDKATRQAAETFESVFLGQMLAPMFKGLSTDGPFGGGHAEEIYRSMMVDEMGTTIAKNGGLGIADAIYDHLLRLQEI